MIMNITWLVACFQTSAASASDFMISPESTVYLRDDATKFGIFLFGAGWNPKWLQFLEFSQCIEQREDGSRTVSNKYESKIMIWWNHLCCGFPGIRVYRHHGFTEAASVTERSKLHGDGETRCSEVGEVEAKWSSGAPSEAVYPSLKGTSVDRKMVTYGL